MNMIDMKATEASEAYARSWDLHPYAPPEDRMHNPNGNEVG